jgi:Ni2+-binding GTPase involved in maturation of urease and hydrogenase
LKMLLVAGPPSVGKTTVIKRLVESLKDRLKLAYFKMDVVKAYEDVELKDEYGIETKKIYSGDLCPDHAEVMVLPDAYEWADEKQADLLIIESAGLCLRCSPFLSKGLGVVVLSLTAGIHSVEKMQAIISFADIAVLTRIDLVSQAEREIFIQKIQEAHPELKIIETNALQGTSLTRLNHMILGSGEVKIEEVMLKGIPPLGTCTICVGRKEIGWKNHFGVVRKLEGGIADYLYRGD